MQVQSCHPACSVSGYPEASGSCTAASCSDCGLVHGRRPRDAARVTPPRRDPAPSSRLRARSSRRRSSAPGVLNGVHRRSASHPGSPVRSTICLRTSGSPRTASSSRHSRTPCRRAGPGSRPASTSGARTAAPDRRGGRRPRRGGGVRSLRPGTRLDRHARARRAVRRRTRPDVVLMDLRMPKLDGVEAIRVVAAGQSLLSPRVTRGIIEASSPCTPPTRRSRSAPSSSAIASSRSSV